MECSAVSSKRPCPPWWWLVCCSSCRSCRSCMARVSSPYSDMTSMRDERSLHQYHHSAFLRLTGDDARSHSKAAFSADPANRASCLRRPRLPPHAGAHNRHSEKSKDDSSTFDISLRFGSLSLCCRTIQEDWKSPSTTLASYWGRIGSRSEQLEEV